MDTSNRVAAGHPQSFIDPAFFEREVHEIFHKSWICVAHVSELAGPGDYITADLFGAPIVVVKEDDGEIRALSNVCLHRAMPIAKGSGNTRTLTCPYHLWTYDLDGQLKSTPLVKKDEGIDVGKYRLPCLKTEIWEGFVFVSRLKDAAPLAPQITELTKAVAPYRMDQMVHVGTMAYASPWNWKIMVENFMEAYHHIGPHRETLQPGNPALMSHGIGGEQPFSILDMPGVDEDHSPLWAMCLYPHMLFALVPVEPLPFLTWYQFSKVAHDRFDLSIHIYIDAARAGDRDEAKGAMELADLIHQEDIPVCEGVQVGVQSPFAIHGPLTKLEVPLRHFRNWIDHQLAG